MNWRSLLFPRPIELRCKVTSPKSSVSNSLNLGKYTPLRSIPSHRAYTLRTNEKEDRLDVKPQPQVSIASTHIKRATSEDINKANPPLTKFEVSDLSILVTPLVLLAGENTVSENFL